MFWRRKKRHCDSYLIDLSSVRIHTVAQEMDLDRRDFLGAGGLILGGFGLATGADSLLPGGVKAVWDLEKAHREKTKTRERICLSYIQDDCQTLYLHPNWKDAQIRTMTAAWYQRDLTVPEVWKGRRIGLATDYVNSFAIAYLDGKKVGEIRFPGGEIDLTSAASPGKKQTLSLLVVALPLLMFETTTSYQRSDALQMSEAEVALLQLH